MKTAGIALIVIAAFLAVFQIRSVVMANYTYEKTYSQLWALADKSSTIPAKQQYISQFLDVLKKGKENGDFANYDALFLKTPNNSFDANVKALQTLSERLTEIQGMNPNSFEYNTAIQQITAQEQGEAHAMLAVFQGCYDLNSYFFVWDWVGGLIFCSEIVFVIFGWKILD